MNGCVIMLASTISPTCRSRSLILPKIATHARSLPVSIMEIIMRGVQVVVDHRNVLHMCLVSLQPPPFIFYVDAILFMQGKKMCLGALTGLRQCCQQYSKIVNAAWSSIFGFSLDNVVWSKSTCGRNEIFPPPIWPFLFEPVNLHEGQRYMLNLKSAHKMVH